jgi:hypothetical protein
MHEWMHHRFSRATIASAMRRFWTAAGLLLFVALALGACSEGASGGGGFSGGGAPVHAACHLYTSCATCTPLDGCGWCYLADGTGECARQPDDCTGTAFSWTWEPTGCHVAAEAGVSTIEAGPPPGDAKAGSDAGQDASGAEAAAGDADGMTSDVTSPGEAASEASAPALDGAGEAGALSDGASAE